MKTFNIDFNWSLQDGQYKAATPGLFHNADTKKIVDWYRWIGADCFWTFATSYNGYAWYDSKFAPKTPKLTHDFLGETTRLGKENKMKVFAYVCVSSNPWWEENHPEMLRLNAESGMGIVPCEKYMDHLCNVLVESATRYDFDGFALDWFRHPLMPRTQWIDCEKKLYQKLMGDKFPDNCLPDQFHTDTYNKKMIEYMWNYIKKPLEQVRPLEIWANEPFQHNEDIVWQDNEFLKSIHYTLNESFDLSLIPKIKGYANNIKVIQNVCGWKEHDVTIMDLGCHQIDGLFGFAQADEKTCLPERKKDSSNGGDIMDINYSNILAIRDIFLNEFKDHV